MNYTTIKPLPSAEELKKALPLDPLLAKKIAEDRAEIRSIIAGQDSRLLIITGPCSAWPSEAVLEYANRLKKLSTQLDHNLKIVMRVYLQKPRTIKGWLGPINQPDPSKPPDIAKGLYYGRQLMLDVLKLGLPIADEALFLHQANPFLELLSWVAIGARSSENQEHRLFASSLDIPTGMKNPTHGNLTVAINSLIAAQHPHVINLDHHQVETFGNPYAHLVLRGANREPNYSLNHLCEAQKKLTDNQIQNPAILIDVSHDNSFIHGKKDYSMQPNTVFTILKMLDKEPQLKNHIKGFMLESFIESGAQKINLSNPQSIKLNGLSITDPCISWEETENLLLALNQFIEQSSP